MNISWVVSNTAALDPLVGINDLKNLGSIWGGWQTWRQFQTDNVICYDMIKAKELIARRFHDTCNFYVPASIFSDLEKPSGVKLYEGTFNHDVERREEIVAMHLAATVSDIVLLLGFDFSQQPKLEDRLLEHRAHNYRSLTKQAMINNPAVQWVLVDHSAPFRKDLQDLENIGQDTLANMISSQH